MTKNKRGEIFMTLFDFITFHIVNFWWNPESFLALELFWYMQNNSLGIGAEFNLNRYKLEVEII